MDTYLFIGFFLLSILILPFYYKVLKILHLNDIFNPFKKKKKKQEEERKKRMTYLIIK